MTSTTKTFAVVVGAGPAGATAAREILRTGLGPVALLDRARFPRSKPCAGGLSGAARRQLSQLGLLERVQALSYPIAGALIQAPSGRSVVLEGGEGALVLDRSRLDHLLVKAAVEQGADLHEGARATRIEPAPLGWLRVLTDSGAAFEARHVVVATGAVAPLAFRSLPKTRLTTMTAWYEGVEFVPGRAELYFDEELTPHYGWLFPEGSNRVNIGLCVDERNRGDRPMRSLFSGFLERHFADRMACCRQVRPPRGHPIAAVSSIPEPSTPPGVLVVGEAARLANRATGEGISLALASGRMAAGTVRQAIAKGWDPAETSRHHLAGLRRKLGPDLILADKATGVLPTALNATAVLGQVEQLRPLLQRLAAVLQ